LLQRRASVHLQRQQIVALGRDHQRPDRAQITALLRQIQKGAIDAELQNNLAAFADTFVVAR
jgi:hypothetical protein